MAYGDTAIFAGGAAQPAAVDWETDYAASPAVAKKATFDIKEGDTPQTVAQNLAAAFNSSNPGFSATATGDKVVFTAAEPTYKVSDMRFVINGGLPENLPASGASVAVGNTGLSVNNANG